MVERAPEGCQMAYGSLSYYGSRMAEQVEVISLYFLLFNIVHS